MGLTYKIAKWSVNKLIKRGVDLSGIVNISEEDKKLKSSVLELNEALTEIMTEIDTKRAEIVSEQSTLLNLIEGPYMNMLAESKDNLEKTTMTKVWLDSYDSINNLITIHENLISLYESKNDELTKIQEKYEV